MPRKEPIAPGAGPVLLSGGNPRIPLGYGAGPVRAYIAAMPGWKRSVGEEVDAIVAAVLPGAARAVKWNTPFWGIAEGDWFLSLHCYRSYVQAGFLNGALLDPMPPKASKSPRVRYLDIFETPGLDRPQFADWVAQAARLPGERL